MHCLARLVYLTEVTRWPPLHSFADSDVVATANFSLKMSRMIRISEYSHLIRESCVYNISRREAPLQRRGVTLVSCVRSFASGSHV